MTFLASWRVGNSERGSLVTNERKPVFASLSGPWELKTGGPETEALCDLLKRVLPELYKKNTLYPFNIYTLYIFPYIFLEIKKYLKLSKRLGPKGRCFLAFRRFGWNCFP